MYRAVPCTERRTIGDLLAEFSLPSPINFINRELPASVASSSLGSKVPANAEGIAFQVRASDTFEEEINDSFAKFVSHLSPDQLQQDIPSPIRTQLQFLVDSYRRDAAVTSQTEKKMTSVVENTMMIIVDLIQVLLPNSALAQTLLLEDDNLAFAGQHPDGSVCVTSGGGMKAVFIWENKKFAVFGGQEDEDGNSLKAGAGKIISSEAPFTITQHDPQPKHSMTTKMSMALISAVPSGYNHQPPNPDIDAPLHSQKPCGMFTDAYTFLPLKLSAPNVHGIRNLITSSKPLPFAGVDSLLLKFVMVSIAKAIMSVDHPESGASEWLGKDSHLAPSDDQDGKRGGYNEEENDNNGVKEEEEVEDSSGDDRTYIPGGTYDKLASELVIDQQIKISNAVRSSTSIIIERQAELPSPPRNPLLPPRPLAVSAHYPPKEGKVGEVYHCFVSKKPNLKFVLKFAKHRQEEALSREASIYSKYLRRFPYAPQYYGIYRGVTPTDKIWAVMLEDMLPDKAASTDSVPLSGFSPSQIVSFQKAVHQLHHFNVYHNDLAFDENVIAIGDRIIILDYSNAYYHKCKGKKCAELRWVDSL